MFPQPLVAFGPRVTLLHVNRLGRALAFALHYFGARAADCAEQAAPDENVEEQEHDRADKARENTLAPVHSCNPREIHFGFPSSRNCACSFCKMRGGFGSSNCQACNPGFFFALSAN